MPRQRPGYEPGYLSKKARELGVTRQRIWQILQKEEGKCQLCPAPVYFEDGVLCRYHLDLHNVRQSKKKAISD